MDKVIIVEYNPQWPLLFDREAERIRNVVDGDLINRIEHFGSTAVPGLAAKPIIDLLVGVHSLVQAKQIAISQLQTLDYAYWYDNPDPQRMFFIKGLPPSSHRTHHIHMVEPDSRLWERLAFRDYLCEHPHEAANYAQFKVSSSATVFDRSRSVHESQNRIYRVCHAKNATVRGRLGYT